MTWQLAQNSGVSDRAYSPGGPKLANPPTETAARTSSKMILGYLFLLLGRGMYIIALPSRDMIPDVTFGFNRSRQKPEF